jgi:hypothetical protein
MAPFSAKSEATVLLPEPMPPVKPIVNIFLTPPSHFPAFFIINKTSRFYNILFARQKRNNDIDRRSFSYYILPNFSTLV